MANVDMNPSFRRGHRRYQSVMAQQFSSQLDDLFNMDSGLDTLVHDVEAKRQSIFVQQRELEELQERIRRAEAQLGQSSDEENEEDSDTSESDTPAAKAPEPARARATTYSARQPSIFAIRETKDEEEAPKPTAKAAAAAGAPVSQVPTNVEYVMVRRPRPAPRKKAPRVDSHIEISEEDEEEEEDEDEEDDSEEMSEEESSEEEAPAPVRSPVRRR